MQQKRCFFIGHRETSSEVYPALIDLIEKHITEYGVKEFMVGHYGSFDRLALKALCDAKQKHPELTILLLVPYHPAERPVSKPMGVDEIFYPPGMEQVPRRFAIVRANEYAVKQAGYLIAYVWHPASNAGKLMAYAARRAKKGLIVITNLAGEDGKNERKEHLKRKS